MKPFVSPFGPELKALMVPRREYIVSARGAAWPGPTIGPFTEGGGGGAFRSGGGAVIWGGGCWALTCCMLAMPIARVTASTLRGTDVHFIIQTSIIGMQAGIQLKVQLLQSNKV